MSPSVRSISRILLVGFMGFMGLSGAAPVVASSLTVEWDANITDGDLDGYRVYMTTDPAVFNLTPAAARAQATTRDVDSATTSTVFTDLDPNLTYWFGVTAFDTSGNESVFSNIDSGTPPDVTAPSVSIGSPAAGETVSGSISITATAGDNVGVTGVQFRLDGANLGPEDTTAPYLVAWDTTTASDGPHTLTAVARDAAGNTTTSSPVAVTVDNPDTTAPGVGITSPSGGAVLSGSVSVTADASDDEGVAGVQFRLDGANLGPEDTTAPYLVAWNTTTVANGPHTLTAVARDTAGNVTTSAPVAVTVTNADTTPPMIVMTSPSAGATVSGSVAVSASATDDIGVAGVQFKLNGTNLGSEVTSAPYNVNWDTSLVPNGAHNLSAVARDEAGNATTSALITVMVDNADTTPPTVSITSPSQNATVTGTVTITADAADNVGVAGVRFRVNGQDVGTEDTSAPWSAGWDTTPPAPPGNVRVHP